MEKDLNLTMDIKKLESVLENSYEEIGLSIEMKDDTLCEAAIPRLEHYLIDAITKGSAYLHQEQNRLLSPEVENNKKFKDELGEILRKIFIKINKLASKGALHFYAAETENMEMDYDPAQQPEAVEYDDDVRAFTESRLRGEKPENPWGWLSVKHLKVCMLLIEKTEELLNNLAHTDEYQTKEVIDRLAQEAFEQFKKDNKIISQNCLKDWNDELDGERPSTQFINEKRRELLEKNVDKELMQMAQDYFGDWSQLLGKMKGEYKYEKLRDIFIYYFKREVLKSLKTNGTKNKDNAQMDVEDKLRNSIIQLQNEKIMVDYKGVKKEEYIFRYANDWIAVFRVLVDHGHFSNTDYKGFFQYMNQQDKGQFRIPCKYNALKDISKSVFFKPLHAWKYDTVYHSTYERYEQMLQLAHRYLEIYQQTT